MGKKKIATVPSEVKTYVVTARLLHDGEHYRRGEEIELTEEQAAPLLVNASIVLPAPVEISN